jgi:PPOX class probable F420-dependent enzyme
VNLPEDLAKLLRQPVLCYLATTMPDGSPQLTQVWVDTDGEHVLVNSVLTHVKTANIRRDPRVALTITDPERQSRYHQIRGRVVEVRTEGAAEHIDELSLRYLGRPYAWYGGRDQARVMFVIEPSRITGI